MVRRWHFWMCFQGEDRVEDANNEIKRLEIEGFKAKIFAPLPQHKISGHVHVVILGTIWEKLKLVGFEEDYIKKLKARVH